MVARPRSLIRSLESPDVGLLWEVAADLMRGQRTTGALAIASRLLGAPVALLDRAGRVTAHEDSDSELDPGWLDLVTRKRLCRDEAELSQFANAIHLLERSPRVDVYESEHALGCASPLALAAVRTPDGLQAALAARWPPRRVPEAEAGRILGAAAVILSLDAHWRTAAVRAGRHALEEALCDLLHGRVTELLPVRQQMLALGLDLCTPRRTYFARVLDRATSAALAGPACQTLAVRLSREWEPTGTAFVVRDADDDGLAVVAGSAEQDLAARIAEDLQQHARVISAGAAVFVGMSGPCQQPGDYPLAHRHAVLAARVARRRRLSAQPLALEALGLLPLLDSVRKTAELGAFARNALGPLISYDQQHGTALTETLAAFLFCDGDAARVATELVVHPRTVRYRIQRAEELLDARLTEHATLTRLYAACELLQALGLDSFPD